MNYFFREVRSAGLPVPALDVWAADHDVLALSLGLGVSDDTLDLVDDERQTRLRFWVYLKSNGVYVAKYCDPNMCDRISERALISLERAWCLARTCGSVRVTRAVDKIMALYNKENMNA